MKSILKSVKPEWVAKILNKQMFLLPCKNAPEKWTRYLSKKSDVRPAPRPVYVYCTKKGILIDWEYELDGERYEDLSECPPKDKPQLQGKVVAKFMLKDVFKETKFSLFKMQADKMNEKQKRIAKECGVSWYELYEYANKHALYFWSIDDLEIFDTPKELSDFKFWDIPYPKHIKWPAWSSNYYSALGHYIKQHPAMMCGESVKAFDESISIKHAPRNWQYVEAE